MNRKDQGGFDSALAVLLFVLALALMAVVFGGLLGVLGRWMGWW